MRLTISKQVVDLFVDAVSELKADIAAFREKVSEEHRTLLDVRSLRGEGSLQFGTVVDLGVREIIERLVGRSGIIYIATNTRNLKSYVGQTLGTVGDCKDQHFHAARQGSNRHFHRAIRHHGEDVFEWRVLESNIPAHRVGDRKKLWIGFFNSRYNGYNSTQVAAEQIPEVAAKSAATSLRNKRKLQKEAGRQFLLEDDTDE